MTPTVRECDKYASCLQEQYNDSMVSASRKKEYMHIPQNIAQNTLADQPTDLAVKGSDNRPEPVITDSTLQTVSHEEHNIPL
jgi:hypothetical protein